ncbi:hypothetical protein CR513_20216, partial [Mucuna pruriens]
MTLEISHNYMFYSSVHEIWENLIERYSMKKDFAACYDIESKIFNSRKGTLLVTDMVLRIGYGSRLKMCKVDFIAHTRIVERRRIFKFLYGLNSEYDLIRVQILGKEKLPSLFEVFFIVRSEET